MKDWQKIIAVDRSTFPNLVNRYETNSKYATAVEIDEALRHVRALGGVEPAKAARA